jgi:integrase
LPKAVVTLAAESRAALVDYVQQFRDRVQASGPLFPTRTGKCLDALAYRRRIVTPALSKVAPGFKPATFHPAGFPPTVQQRLLAHPLDTRRLSQRDALVCQLELWLGLRPEEFSRIRKRDIEFGHGTILLRDTKSGHDQLVPIPAPLGTGLKAFVEPLKPDDPMFRRPDGKPMRRRQVEIALRHWSDQRGVRGVTPQIVRRSLATILEDRGASPVQIESLLRHSGTSVLRRHYCAALEFHPFNERR